MYIRNFTNKLKERLNIEFNKQDRSGVYGFTQRSMAYNSNRIEGSTLTEKQTASIFETGTIIPNDDDIYIKTKDIEEMTGHFKMFNYTLTVIDEPLSENIICQMHKNLKEGVFEDKANGYAIGSYKTRANIVADIETVLPQDVPIRMKELLDDYNSKKAVTLKDIAKLHADFENVHPFQDGNGRVGRMIIFKECIKHNMIPVIIKDTNKIEYMKHLNNAQKHNNLRGLTDYFRKEQEQYVNDTAKFLFDYTELDNITQNIQNELINDTNTSGE